MLSIIRPIFTSHFPHPVSPRDLSREVIHDPGPSPSNQADSCIAWNSSPVLPATSFTSVRASSIKAEALWMVIQHPLQLDLTFHIPHVLSTVTYPSILQSHLWHLLIYLPITRITPTNTHIALSYGTYEVSTRSPAPTEQFNTREQFNRVLPSCPGQCSYIAHYPDMGSLRLAV